MTTPFPGFAAGPTRNVLLPAAFITDLLPLIDDADELKVVLYAFYAIQQREGRFRYVRREDFLHDPDFMRGLSDGAAALTAALKAACDRGALLGIELPVDDQMVQLYFINAEPGRTALEQIQAGRWKPGSDGTPIEIMPERPNAYQLYERNIGPLTPMISDYLKDAERDYPQGWLEDAIRVSVEHNKRSWKYISAVLERWRREGKRNEDDARRIEPDERRLPGNLSDFIIR